MSGITPPPIPKRRKSRAVLFFLIPVLSFAAILVLAWVTYLMVNARQEAQLLEECRRNHEPVSAAELAAAMPKVPDADNAALLFLKIWAEDDPDFWSAFQNGQPLPKRRNPPDFAHTISPWDFPQNGRLAESNRTALALYLQPLEDHLEQVRQASRRPLSRYPVKIEKGWQALLPHLPQLRLDALQLDLHAINANESGQIQVAVTDLEAAIRIRELMGQEPISVSYIQSVHCLFAEAKSLERILSLGQLSAPQLQTLAGHYSRPYPTQTCITNSLCCDRACFFTVFSLSDETIREFWFDRFGDTNHVPDMTQMRILFGALSFLGIKQADEVHLLGTIRSATDLAENPSLESNQDWIQLFDDANTDARGFPPKLVSSFVLPRMRMIMSDFLTAEAKWNSMQMALAIEQYRIKYGRLPGTLQELVPTFLSEIPQDPFSQSHLKVRHLSNNGYVVYSVGPDGIDDHARESALSPTKRTVDISFFVEH